jgi:PAS domain S-box-containing protein
MFANVKLVTGEKSNVVLIDEDALDREGSIEFVWIVDDKDRAYRKRVLSGAKDINGVEILAWLKEGDIVVTTGQLKLAEGRRVKILNKQEFDESGKMVSVKWSPEFRKMIGYKDENDFPDEIGSWADLLHPDDREAVLKEYNDTIADYSGQKNYDVEYRLKVKSGEYRWFHAIGRLLRRDNGVPLSYVGMFVDITDKKNGEIYAGSDL